MNFQLAHVALLPGFALLTASLLACSAGRDALADGDGPDPTAVKIVEQDGGYTLLRNGEPYVILGAGGERNAAALDLLVRRGGNSARTWDVGPETRGQLDRAHERGLTVTVGFWFPHVTPGVTYDDPALLEQIRNKVRDGVLAHRDHPAVLMWALGNEMEHAMQETAGLYQFVNELALMVKALDPHRPVITVVSEVVPDKIRNLHRHAPALDAVGINTYAGASSVAERYRQTGATKPYILTEFGPLGPWEVGKTSFGAPIEPTSDEKVAQYRKHYQAAVSAELGRLCLGSYAFLWGNKQESTATWFGLFRPFVPEGEPIQTHAAVDVLEEMWTGQAPPPTAPTLTPLELNADVVPPRAAVQVSFDLADPNGDPLDLHWEVRHDTHETVTMGAYRPVDQVEPTTFVPHPQRQSLVGFRAPDRPGYYRVYLYATDGNGRFATANAAFQVVDE